MGHVLLNSAMWSGGHWVKAGSQNGSFGGSAHAVQFSSQNRDTYDIGNGKWHPKKIMYCNPNECDRTTCMQRSNSSRLSNLNWTLLLKQF